MFYNFWYDITARASPCHRRILYTVLLETRKLFGRHSSQCEKSQVKACCCELKVRSFLRSFQYWESSEVCNLLSVWKRSQYKGVGVAECSQNEVGEGCGIFLVVRSEDSQWRYQHYFWSYRDIHIIEKETVPIGFLFAMKLLLNPFRIINLSNFLVIFCF